MMLFYQVRSHFHKTVDLPKHTCASCNNRGTMEMRFMQKYVWMFGPIMPNNKYAIVACQVCENQVPITSWTKELDGIYKQEKKTLKTPFRMWRGMIIMLLIFIIPYTLFSLNILKIANPATEKQIESVIISNVKDFKKGDVLFISLNTSSKIDYHTLANVVETEGAKTILKKYSEKFEYMDKDKLTLSSLDHSKFIEEIAVKTEPLRGKSGNLIPYTLAPEKKNDFAVPFGRAVLILKP